jgi:hypothetical protein
LPDNHERIMQERSFEASLAGGRGAFKGSFFCHGARTVFFAMIQL